MAQLIILGSSNAVPSINHENTHFIIVTPGRQVLVDCGANAVVSMEKAGLDVNQVSDLILTHFHPDHVGSLPLLLMNMWLTGRRNGLNIHGLAFTLDRAESMMDLFCWKEWPDFFPVNFNRIPEKNMARVLEDANMRIYSSPVKHMLPNICLRFELSVGKKNIVYSCDTEPCQAVQEIAMGADILLHETAGAGKGHTSAEQAGEIAQVAGVSELYLIHYPTGRYSQGDLIADARKYFTGRIVQALDLMKIELGNSSE